MSIHSQRSTYAHNLGKDPKSTEQGFVWDIVPWNMRDMEFVDGGIHFVHIYGGSGIGTIQPRRIAVALPLAFAQSLANVALGPEAESRASAIKSNLNLWHDKSFLFDMILEDERALRLKKRRPDSHPVTAIFQKHPTLMPRVFKSWAPLNTVVEIYSEAVIVIYKDQNQNNLIRVRIGRAPEIQPIKVAPRPCAVNANLRFVDDHVYDLPMMKSIPGGLCIPLRIHGFFARHVPDISPLTIAVPSDLAKVIKSIAINAVRWEPYIRNATPTELVNNGVRHYMAEWNTPYKVLMKLNEEDETIIRHRHKIPDDDKVGDIFRRHERLPPFYQDWNAVATTIEKRETYITVTFKNNKDDILIEVRMKH